jgi:hypothetical protein
MSSDSLKNQLEKHYPRGRSNARLIDVELPPLSIRKVDGVDHLNIWESGRTKLGKFLAPAAPVAFMHPVFGPFNSIESFWHYIRNEERDDRLRSMPPITARKYARRLHSAHIPNFYAVIMDAIWYKLAANKQMMERFKSNDLPLDMYYIFRESGLPIRANSINWLMPGFNEIEKALKEDRNPNFTFLMSEPADDIYVALMPDNTHVPKQREYVETVAVVEEQDTAVTDLPE